MDKYSRFSHLSIKDLVEARDQFHVHLMNKKNVVATAIGRYLIRRADIDKHGNYHPPADSSKPRPTRTLENSVVIDISWPCVLVFVNQWEHRADLVKQTGDNVVPKTIYMPDGRVVPVCIVEAPQEEFDDDEVDPHRLRFPDNLIGGGFPLLMHSQGIDWVATVGCVVADGHRYYALTNKHVTGDGGEQVYSRFGADQRRIGIASGRTLGKLPFSRLYDSWNSSNVYVNCDVGLVEIDDLNRWKTDVVQLGEFGELYDLNTQNIDLNLIAEHAILDREDTSLNGKVVGYGAVTGRMEGEIRALFYRYKSVGGRDYVSDFLISGRNGKNLKVQHGDSGTLWLLETPREDDDAPAKPKGSKKSKKSSDSKAEEPKIDLRPIALHWGQHKFVDGKTQSRSTYSLATCLSNVCRELEVELIRDWNISLDYSWGKVGHYTIGTFAVTAIQNLATDAGAGITKLKHLMTSNLDNISFPEGKVNADIAAKNNPALSTNPKEGFCPLADVPDIIWKQSRKNPWGRQGDENPNHYADADAPTIPNGYNLYKTCASKAELTVKVWTDYYEKIDKDAIGLGDGTISQGLICFRVWQIFDYMVDALKKKKNPKYFIFAAGVLAHYVGDACQPLHSSYMSNGDPRDNEMIDYTAKRDSPAGSKHPHQKGDVYKKLFNPGAGVHSAYEDAMVDDNIADILKSVSAILGNKSNPLYGEPIPIGSGQEAGFAVLQLMQKTQEDIAPKDIVELYKKIKGDSDVSARLFEEFGEATGKCMARGCIYLAAIWKAAWVAGGGEGTISSVAAVDPDDLSSLYADRDELPSKHLDTIANEIPQARGNV